MKTIYKATAFLFAVLTFFSYCPVVFAENDLPFDVNAKSAVLMEATTGTVLYSKNADEPLPPASVTKVMTLLLVMESVDSGALTLDEKISVSEYAASMGGSQVFLEPGEQMSAEELIKCVVIASANDAAVTLAERIAGSETAFVAMMNERAVSLGLKNSRFENVTGLDDDTVDHVMSANDIAVISRELLKHRKILEFSKTWMDSIRNGAFGLTNTNRLIRFYNGATGLKTGSTSKAKFCISATAERDGMHLIAVIMGSDTRDTRNEAAKQLLDWGFATYCLYKNDGGKVGDVKVIGGKKERVDATCPSVVMLLPKSKQGTIVPEYLFDNDITAPLKTGDKVGEVRYVSGDDVLSNAPITVSESVERVGFFDVLIGVLKSMILK